MAKSQAKYGACHTYSLIAEPNGMCRQEEDLEEAAVASRWCCFGVGRSMQESRILLRQNDQIGNFKDCWMVNELKNMEFSEIVGGPKCKNMAKRAGGYCKWRRSRKIECMYSPETYALNFDDGDDDDRREDRDLLFILSSKFSSPPCNDKERSVMC